MAKKIQIKASDGTDLLLNAIYPVGSIYMSVNSTSPSTLFGGTWEKIKDRFLLASGSSYTLGNTGGEATHTLTVSEMPSHYHDQAMITSDGSLNHMVSSLKSGNYSGASPQTQEWWASSRANIPTFSSGGGQAHNNMPPYLVVNVWKRTA